MTVASIARSRLPVSSTRLAETPEILLKYFIISIAASISAGVNSLSPSGNGLIQTCFESFELFFSVEKILAVGLYFEAVVGFGVRDQLRVALVTKVNPSIKQHHGQF